MADYALVKEAMVELGEQLDGMGYDGCLEVIEGNGLIGEACKDCRTQHAAKVVAEHLKDLHQTFRTRRPDPEGNAAKAMQAVQAAWRTVRAALSDDPNIAALEASVPQQPGPGPVGARPMGVPRPGNMPTARPQGRNMPSFRPGMPTPPRR